MATKKEAATKTTSPKPSKTANQVAAEFDLPEVAFLKKINKLQKFTLGGRMSQPKLFGQERYNPNSNEMDDIQLKWEGNSILGAKRNLCPQWNKLDNRWAFQGTYQQLCVIAKKLKLRDRDQNIIIPDEDCFTNKEDKFFSHLTLSGTVFMVDGSISLTRDNPIEEFYMRSYLDNPEVQNSTKNQSKAMISGAELEIWSPKAETAKKRVSIDKIDEAIVALKGMSIDRQRYMANILRPTGYDPLSEDTNLLYIELRDGAALNTQKSSKFRNKTWQDMFLELEKDSDEELFVKSRIILGRYKGAFTKKGGIFTFMGKPLDEVRDELDLIEYFRNPDNSNQYIELDNFLGDSIE